MITRIELENFMSHGRTVIELTAGLTVLVGPNNCGKSAVVSALQILCENAGGDYMVRHDAKDCSVVVMTDDGHRIEWCRRNNVVSYTLNGTAIHRVGRKVPDELHTLLRLPKVETADGKDTFDIHFALQKSPIFLLNEPGSRAATFFAASSDAAKLIEMQARHREKVRQSNQEERASNVKAEVLQAQLEVLAPLADIEVRADQAKRDYQSLASMVDRLAAMERFRLALAEHVAVAEHCAAEVLALSHLAPPPARHSLDPLHQLIEGITTASKSVSAERDRQAALSRLTTPPPMSNVDALELLAISMQRAFRNAVAEGDRAHALVGLTPPTPLGKVDIFAACISKIGGLEGTISRLQDEDETLRALTGPPRLADVPQLVQLTQRLGSAEKRVARILVEREALAATPAPPLMHPVDRMRERIDAMARAVDACAFHQNVIGVLANLGTVPEEVDYEPLKSQIASFTRLLKNAAEQKSLVDTAVSDLTQADHALRDWAKANRVCPVCGGEVDPDKLVKTSVAGIGGHSHG